MKVILLSVHPQHCCNILNEIKVDEIRKTIPKCDLPIDVYIYCSYGLCLHDGYKFRDGKYTLAEFKVTGKSKPRNALNGKVVAKFTLKAISEYECEFSHDNEVQQYIVQVWRDDDEYPGEVSFAEIITTNEKAEPDNCKLMKSACLSFEEVRQYANYDNATLYAWHITDLVVFDKPMELEEFTGYCKEKVSCYTDFVRHCNNMSFDWKCNRLTRPPQSWQYVEVDNG